MDRVRSLAEARRDGSLTAARELVRLHLDTSHPIDIYDVITRAGLWLVFQPLADTLGIYLPIGAGGVLINSQRPRSVQRLTAAHEYGHCVLKHEVGFDSRELIEPGLSSRQARNLGRSASRQGLWTLPLEVAMREAAAQAFATDFLMPPQLVNRLWAELDLESGRPFEAKDAYLLSLFCGTSFAAMLFQLVSLKKVPQTRAQELLKITPGRIKKSIGGGAGPADHRADVWQLHLSDSGRHLQPAVRDELQVSLPESPSTGYIWVPQTSGVVDLRGDRMPNTQNAAFGLVEDRFEGPSSLFDEALIGDGGYRTFLFRALQPGQVRLRLENRRPWQTNAETAASFEVDLDIIGQPTGVSDRGLVEEQQRLLSA